MLHFHYNRLNNAERWDEGDGDYDLPNRNSQPSQTNNGIPNIDALQACEQTQSSHHTIEYQQQTQGFATPMVNVDAQSSTMLIHNLEVRARDTSDHLLNGQQGTPLSEQQEDFSIESLLARPHPSNSGKPRLQRATSSIDSGNILMDNPPHPYSEQKNEVVGSAIPSSAHIHTRQSPMFTDKTDGSQRNVNMQSEWRERHPPRNIQPTNRGPLITNDNRGVNGRRGVRNKIPDSAIRALEGEFEVTPYIKKDRRKMLASLLDLTDRQVLVWFQNRRTKQKREVDLILETTTK